MIRRIGAGAAVVLAVAAGLWTVRERHGAPSVIGDGAPAVATALTHGPAVEVVLLRRWQSLEHVPDLRRLCRAACDGSAPVVELRQPAWAGLRRVLFIDMGAIGAGAALDAGGPVPPEVVRRVVAAVGGAGERRVAWRLPRGL